MTQPGHRAVLGGAGAAAEAGAAPAGTAAAGTGRAAGQAAGSGRFDPGPAWMRVVPPVAMLGMALWRITGSSYWRDEAATLTAVRRPFGELLRMMGHVDAVHGVYYMFIWVAVRLGGPGELVTRLPSALAMAAAAAAVAALGRRLVSPRAGLAAGLLFAALPQVSLYAQDAREYAGVAALATTGSYLLVRAMTDPGRRGRCFTGYAACLGLMGLLNVFSLLLLGAHAITVALAWWRGADRWDGRRSGRAGALGGRPPEASTGRRLALGWLAAAAGATALASPVLALGYTERGTLSWLARPQVIGAVEGLRKLIGPAQMLLALCVAIGIGIVLSALGGRAAFGGRAGLSGRAGLRAAWPGPLLGLCLPWLLFPPAVLIGVSQVSPVYTFRYVLFCAPAAALLGGAGLAALIWPPGGALSWVPATVAFAVVVALGVPAQFAARAPNGHGTDIRKANAVVVAHRQPGDAVLFLGNDSNYFPAAYSSGFGRLDDIGQRLTPSQAGNLVGVPFRTSVIRERLAHVRRVWVIRLGAYPHGPVPGPGFHLVRRWQISRIWMLLFVRGSAG
jgi:mannosyltransferase